MSANDPLQTPATKTPAYYDRVTLVTATAPSSPHRAHGCGMIRTTNEEK
jgi:hypothetical protein